MMRPPGSGRKAGHEAAEHATVGPVIVGSRQVTMAGAPARSHGLRAGALSSRYIISANTRHGLTKCNVKRNLSDRIVRQGREHDRAEAARRGLAGAGSAYLRLLPVIVTSKTRNEITPDLEDAERLGVLVVTRETLENAIDQRTLMLPNADQVYAEAEQAIKEALAKYPPLGSRPM
jgi:hypothetical protein